MKIILPTYTFSRRAAANSFFSCSTGGVAIRSLSARLNDPNSECIFFLWFRNWTTSANFLSHNWHSNFLKPTCANRWGWKSGLLIYN